MSTSGRRPNEPQWAFERRIIREQEALHRSPEITIKTVMENPLGQALMECIYEKHDGRWISKSHSDFLHADEKVYLEVNGVRYEFRITPDGHMDFNDNVMTMTLNLLGRPVND